MNFLKNMPSIISIGYGRNFFVPGNEERERMTLCAQGTAELHMIIFTSASDGHTIQAVSEKLTLHPTASRTRFLMVIDAFRIARALIKKNPTTRYIVTTQDPFETALIGICLKYLYGVKLAVQEHGDFFGQPYWRRESVLNRFRYLFGIFAQKRADLVRVVSRRQQKKLAARGISTATVLPVAISRERYQNAVPSSVVQFQEGTFVFLSVARFVPQKNLSSLLQAFRTVHCTHPHARLVLVGRGPEEAKLRALLSSWYTEKENPVTILPWSDDVPGLMKASSAYVLSSYYEGWGRVLVEAMAAGLPVVTTDVGCAGEVVTDGVHGLVVPVADTDALGEAMERMIDDSQFYHACRKELSSLEHIPGTASDSYGHDWLKTFESLQ